MTLKTTSGPQFARIASFGGYRGSRVVDNAEMCTFIDSSDEWIQQRTGIVDRRWATEEETPLYMATNACTDAISRAGLGPDDIDAVVVSTVSHFQQSPSIASQLADALGLSTGPAVFDISAACAGFSYAVTLADSMVRSGTAKNVLICGVETLTKLTDFTDRATAFLFGDGAGAAVITGADEPSIGPPSWGSDPTKHEVIYIDDWRDVDDKKVCIRMVGNKVYRWATTFVTKKAAEAITLAGLEPEDLNVFIPHQANNRITDSMIHHMSLPESVKVSRDIRHMGNSSAASIPLAALAMLESGEAKSGDLALIIGFGAGLVFSGQVIKLP